MSPALVPILVVYGGFPRVSGDEPSGESMTGRTFWFSPRERG